MKASLDRKNHSIQSEYHTKQPSGKAAIALADQRCFHIGQFIYGLLEEIVAAVRNRISSPTPIERKDISVIIAEDKAKFVALLNGIDTAKSAKQLGRRVAEVQERLNRIDNTILLDLELKIDFKSADNEMEFDLDDLECIYDGTKEWVKIVMCEKIKNKLSEIQIVTGKS